MESQKPKFIRYQKFKELVKHYKKVIVAKCSLNLNKKKEDVEQPSDLKTTHVEMYYFTKEYCVGQLLEPVEKDSRFVDKYGNPIVYGGNVRKWRTTMVKYVPFLFKKPKRVAVHITPVGNSGLFIGQREK